VMYSTGARSRQAIAGGDNRNGAPHGYPQPCTLVQSTDFFPSYIGFFPICLVAQPLAPVPGPARSVCPGKRTSSPVSIRIQASTPPAPRPSAPLPLVVVSPSAINPISCRFGRPGARRYVHRRSPAREWLSTDDRCANAVPCVPFPWTVHTPSSESPMRSPGGGGRWLFVPLISVESASDRHRLPMAGLACHTRGLGPNHRECA